MRETIVYLPDACFRLSKFIAAEPRTRDVVVDGRVVAREVVGATIKLVDRNAGMISVHTATNVEDVVRAIRLEHA